MCPGAGIHPECPPLKLGFPTTSRLNSSTEGTAFPFSHPYLSCSVQTPSSKQLPTQPTHRHNGNTIENGLCRSKAVRFRIAVAAECRSFSCCSIVYSFSTEPSQEA